MTKDPVQPVVVVEVMVVAGTLDVDGVSTWMMISGVVDPNEPVVTVVSVEYVVVKDPVQPVVVVEVIAELYCGV